MNVCIYKLKLELYSYNVAEQWFSCWKFISENYRATGLFV